MNNKIFEEIVEFVYDFVRNYMFFFMVEIFLFYELLFEGIKLMVDIYGFMGDYL